MAIERIALIGFGEVGRILAADLLAPAGRSVSAFDIAFARPTSPQAEAANATGVRVAGSAAEAVRDAELTICAVTQARPSSDKRGRAMACKGFLLSRGEFHRAFEQARRRGPRLPRAPAVMSKPP